MADVMSLRVALVGNPNCGKTSLFNAMTGGRQKVGNYAGVTVERKEGHVHFSSGREFAILDLPGAYSLNAQTPDEQITREVVLGVHSVEKPPGIIVAVCDATQLQRNLSLVLELRGLGGAVILAVNMMDLAEARGLRLDLLALERELDIPVVPVVAVRSQGIPELIAAIEKKWNTLTPPPSSPMAPPVSRVLVDSDVRSRFARVDQIVAQVVGAATESGSMPIQWTQRIDRVVLHPVWGSLLLGLVFGLLFQAIFSWANVPMDQIRNGVTVLSGWMTQIMGPGPLQSLLVDGVIAGVGAVIVFLPQILLLFLFILFLEDSGYMARAAFLMDRMMSRVGLHGRAFIPLLSSFACAIPGIMATRTIENRRDRLTTILVAPLMTCSARLPVYTLLIAAFIPQRKIGGFLGLQGLVMAGLYLVGIVAALVVAMIFKRTLLRGSKPPLLLELPTYKWPSLRSIGVGLLERSILFIRRAGTVILAVSVVIWFLVSYPKMPGTHAKTDIAQSYAGKIGHAMEPWVAPLGFNWKIAVALIPGFAAREVMIGALGTVYAVEENAAAEGAVDGGSAHLALGKKLAQDWSIATALSLLVWYILACQCISTLAVTRRETNSWRWPALMLGYMTALAYLGSFATFHLAKMMGLG